MGRPAAACARGTPACCSTSSRTPTRSSATSPRCSRRASPTHARHRWDELPVDPGRLFVVGDPKQSIYRFRRADIAAFLRARSAFGAAPRRLTRNFRTARPVIDFVNAVFRELIVAEPESQPEYVRARARPRGARRSGRRSCSSAPTPELEKPTADELREREARRRRRGRRPRAARGLAGRRGARTDGHRAVRAVPARRHLHPAPGAHLARPARGRARRRRHPVPGGDVVARLQHPRDPRPARGAAGGRRPHRRARAGERAALAAVRVRRRRPLHLQGGARRPLEPPARRCPRRCRPTTRSATRSGCSPAWHDARLWLVAQRAARPHRPRAARARGRLRPRPAPRPVAARALRDRPGARVRRGRGRQPARLPRLGRPPGQRGRARRRDRAARDRRRRGAHPHHPRRQGPRVPDHDRVGHDHQGAVAHAPACSCGSPTTATRTRCGSRPGSPPRSSSATRRSTSRWTSTRSCGCSTWP